MRGCLGLVVAAVVVVAGCGSNEPAKGSGSSEAAAPWHDGVKAAASAGKVGASDSACPLPVIIDLPDKWKPVHIDEGEFRQADLSNVCEIDAKPAGSIGFLRVWIGPATEPRAALESFVGVQKNARDPQYRDTAVGKGSGAEATWVDPESGRHRAFAVSTPLRTIIISAGTIDDEEYLAMLPALLLAKETLTPVER